MRALGPGFRQRVYEVVRGVPSGNLTTYGDVATVLGTPNVARHVGFALSALPHDTDVPWHRVINAKGTISFRGDDTRGDEQRQRLEAEGIPFDDRGRVPLKQFRWRYQLD